MNSETYKMKLLGDGDIVKQLRFMAKEYDGPDGQSLNAQENNRIKKAALLKAANLIENYELLRVLDNGKSNL